MGRISFLLLILFSSTVFTQTEVKKDAYKFFEYQKISNKLLSEKINSLCSESIKTKWIGFIINYGTPREITARNWQIKKNYSCRQEFPEPRIIFFDGGKNGKSRTEFWIVPPGAKPPIPATQN